MSFDLDLLAPECSLQGTRFAVVRQCCFHLCCHEVGWVGAIPCHRRVYFAETVRCFYVHVVIAVNYVEKWFATASLPLLLVAAVGIVLIATRMLQFVQRTVFKVVPFGAAGEMNLIDVCLGNLITGSYYLYFRTCFPDDAIICSAFETTTAQRAGDVLVRCL